MTDQPSRPTPQEVKDSLRVADGKCWTMAHGPDALKILAAEVRALQAELAAQSEIIEQVMEALFEIKKCDIECQTCRTIANTALALVQQDKK